MKSHFFDWPGVPPLTFFRPHPLELRYNSRRNIKLKRLDRAKLGTDNTSSEQVCREEALDRR